MAERLQKVISQAGLASRREAEKLITAGQVKVNGKVVTELGTKVDMRWDKVEVNGQRLKGEKTVYILLNKPKGTITTLSDPKGRKTVADLVADIPERIYPVGRLDYNTEGVLLFTNDGALTHSLLHPSRKIYKTYVARVLGQPSEEKLDLLRAGIELEDGMTAPATVHFIGFDPVKNQTAVEITIHEGKNRQVRRMFEAIKYPVENLKRVKFATLTLEGVRRGQYRHLTPLEVQALKDYAGQE